MFFAEGIAKHDPRRCERDRLLASSVKQPVAKLLFQPLENTSIHIYPRELIGGGEASAFPEFCLELIELCHREGISVAADSCGHTLRPAGVDVLKAADLILFDLKGMDPEKHRDNTGVSNETILENFRLLTRLGKPVIVRLPIIPGYTDSEGELEKLVALLAASPNVERVDVLPFHTYGRVKYDEFGMEYPLPDTLRPLADSDVAYVIDALTKAGLNAQVGG